MKVKANGIDVEVEDSGQADRPAVLFIMGLSMQLTSWPPALIDAVISAGYRAIRFDNRDIGLSQYFDERGDPNLVWAVLKLRLGLTPKAPYSLSDMAGDAVGVLDALGVQRAHVVGVSMGGMIAQRVALAVPDRVLTLTSIMSTSGARGLPNVRKDVAKAMMTRPASADRGAVIDHLMMLWRLLQGPAFPTDEGALRQRLEASYDRAFHPRGVTRQLLAIMADAKRADELAQVKTPTLVIHGTADPLVHHAGGQDTARRIAGSRFVSVEGMGHDLPPPVQTKVLEALLPHLRAAV
jgi:pimeloyl-ACP methyl ester carboxylesterase